MKLTWIGPYKPVPDRSGADLRSFYLLRALARRGASIRGYFLGSHGDACDPYLEEVHVLESGWLSSSVRALRRRVRGEPLTVGRFHRPELIEQLPDDSLVYVDHLHLVTNVLYDSAPSYWLDEHNIESGLWKQYADRSQWPKRYLLDVEHSALYQYEVDAIRGSSGTGVPSLRDVEDLPGAARERVTEIPNGVPEDWLETGRDRLGAPIDADGTFGFIGKYDWFPNRLGVDEFLSSVWEPFHRDHPGTSLKLAGASPLASWNDYGGVDVLGYVESKQKFFETIDVLVLPLNLGGGTRLKALEAAAKGVPLISTEKGIEGLNLPDQTGVPSIAELLTPLEAFLENPGRWRTQRKKAHRFVEENYRWKTIGQTLWNQLQSIH